MTATTAGLTCGRCGRRSFMGRPLQRMNSRLDVCIDCFCFLTGIDERDPVVDETARSGSGSYVARGGIEIRTSRLVAEGSFWRIEEEGHERIVVGPLTGWSLRHEGRYPGLSLYCRGMRELERDRRRRAKR